MIRIHNALKSSRAAIDLASIMVGIIVIGLIGGVIAATVFAVIPWSQDNAARQQLDNIASAQSAYRGLSTDKDSGLKNAITNPIDTADANQVVLNSSFTGSAGLEKNDLLTSNDNYCVVASSDGSDYVAYVKSGSGKVFKSTSKGVQKIAVQDETTCLGKATDGSGTTPPAPITPVVLGTYSFENGSAAGWSVLQTNSGSITIGAKNLTGIAHSGAYFIQVDGTSASSMGSVRFDTSKVAPNITFATGKNYTVEAWVRVSTAGFIKPTLSAGGVTSTETGDSNTWKKLSVTFTASASTSSYIDFATTTGASGSNYFRVDDITITQNN